jgi:hypothetical protein
MAAGVFSLAAVAVIAAVSVARAPEPARGDKTRDAAAARDLIALMRAGENARWLARYDFTRTLANGRTLTQPLTEARTPTRHVLVGGSAMTVERGDRIDECSLVGARSSCHTSLRTGVVPASEVLRVAIDAGAYDVSRAPSATIGGVEGECFQVLGTGKGLLVDIGTETEACFSAAGVPLRQRVERATGDIDARVARRVQEGVDTRTVDRLERSFGANGALDAP